MTATSAPTGAGLLSPPGRLTNARLTTSPGGPAVTTFPSGTSTVYVCYDYSQTDGHRLDVRMMDAAGNMLFTATRSLSGAGSDCIALTSTVAVGNLYDALDLQATDLILAIDNALANIGSASARYQHIQAALVVINRMRASIAALRGLPLPAEAGGALDDVADRLETARTEGLSALNAGSATAAIPFLQSMRAKSIDLIVALRHARDVSGDAGYPFPPSVDCQPYLVNLDIDGLLRVSLEFAVGDPGRVADIRVAAHRAVIYPGVPGMNETAITATLLDARCEPVTDGTPVTFRVEPQSLAYVTPDATTTVRGEATVVLHAASASGGIVEIVAQSGPARARTSVKLVGTPGAVKLTAGSSRLAPGAETTISIDVTGENDEAVPDGTVVSLRVDPAELGAIAPATVTTTRGRATAIFRAGPGTGAATLRASAGATSGQLVIEVEIEAVPTTVPPFPTAAPTPGATPLPPPTTVPSAPRPECPGRGPDVLCFGTLTVRVYRDDTCNRFYDAAWDRPLADVPVTLAFPNGYVEVIRTSKGGQATFGSLTLRRGETLRVFATLAPDQVLCYNSYAELRLSLDDFSPTGHIGISFRTH